MSKALFTTLVRLASLAAPASAAFAADIDLYTFRNFSLGGVVGSVLAADLDGDGHLDFASTLKECSCVTVHLGDGMGNFSAPRYFSTGFFPRAAVAADFDE